MSQHKVQKHKLITSSELAKSSSAGKSVPLPEKDSISNEIAIVSFSGMERGSSKMSLYGLTNGVSVRPSSYTAGSTQRDSIDNVHASVIRNVASSVKVIRFNPFNKSPDDSEYSGSNATGESESASIGSSESLEASLAELGLTEDYFGNIGAFTLYTAEEIEIAIERCKEMVLKVSQSSSRHKKLVKNLVELQLRLQDLRDGPEAVEPRTKKVLGHRLRKRSSKSMKYHCDCCTNLIWGMLQVWYRCKECDFSCHSKCVNKIRRQCTAVVAKNMDCLQMKICPEVGLAKQQYCCAECKNPIEIAGSEEARLCDYSGLYYCSNCHWNDSLTMPARILHNWDHVTYKVSRQAYQLLTILYNKPLLDVEDINPLLFNFVEELPEIRKMREDILKMKTYFLTCTKARESKLLCMLEDRQHFVDGFRMYSMRDLIETNSGTLCHRLTEIHTTFAKHIKLDCPGTFTLYTAEEIEIAIERCKEMVLKVPQSYLRHEKLVKNLVELQLRLQDLENIFFVQPFCQAKGFICEICNFGEALYPFDAMVSVCPSCSAVFHGDCFSCSDTKCPRCRRKEYKKLVSMSAQFWSEEESGSDTPDVIDDDSIYSSFTNSRASPQQDKDDEKTSSIEIPDRFLAHDIHQPKRDNPLTSPHTSWVEAHRKKQVMGSILDQNGFAPRPSEPNLIVDLEEKVMASSPVAALSFSPVVPVSLASSGTIPAIRQGGNFAQSKARHQANVSSRNVVSSRWHSSEMISDLDNSAAYDFDTNGLWSQKARLKPRHHADVIKPTMSAAKSELLARNTRTAASANRNNGAEKSHASRSARRDVTSDARTSVRTKLFSNDVKTKTGPAKAGSDDVVRASPKRSNGVTDDKTTKQSNWSNPFLEDEELLPESDQEQSSRHNDHPNPFAEDAAYDVTKNPFANAVDDSMKEYDDSKNPFCF